MFNLEFMRYAFIIGILLAICLPLLGSIAVFKRLSMVGDALSHVALGGVALGLVLGIFPIYTAIILSILSLLFIEFIRKKFANFNELTITIVLSFGVGLAGILSPFIKTNNLHQYLFGSILLNNFNDLLIVMIITIISLLFYIIFRKQIFSILYSEDEARIQGINVTLINFIHSIILSIVIAISSKLIGALIVSSLIAIPISSSLLLSKSYKKTIIISLVYSISSVIIGLISSYYLGLPPGSSIVIISIILLILTLIIKEFISLIIKHKSSKL